MSMYIYACMNIQILKSQSYLFSISVGCLNSLAGGIMIYVALVEMIAEDFQQAAVALNAHLKIKMFTAVTTGCAIMAFLAIWA
jgi:zinc transporter ZupT